MPPKLNREQITALEWKTEVSESSGPSTSTHHHSPGPSNSTRGRPTLRGIAQHSNHPPRPASNARSHATQASASNNPFMLLCTDPDSDSLESSESDSAAQTPANSTPQHDLDADTLIGLSDNGQGQALAASLDPYQGLDALEDLPTQVSQLSTRTTSSQTKLQFNPSSRGRPYLRGRGAWSGRGQAGCSQSSRSQSSCGQSFHGKTTRGQSIHGGSRPTHSTASSSRGSSFGPSLGASSRVQSSPGRLRGSRGSPRQNTSSLYSDSIRVNRRMARFLSEHKDKHGSYPRRLQEIATVTGTDVKDPVRHRVMGVDGEYNVMSLEISGSSDDAVQQFRNMFEAWSKKVFDETNPRWADAPGGYIPHVEKARAKAIRDKENKQKFCHPRPDGLPVPTWSTEVEWTSSIKPVDILGLRYEGLDTIRMQNSCWITSRREEGHLIFTVEGDDQGKVSAAVERLQYIDSQGEANRFNAETVHILDVSDGMQNLPDVRLKEYFGYSTITSLGTKPDFASPTSSVSFTKNTGTVAMESLLETITPMTDRARFYRSYLDFRVCLGTFVMTTYPAGVQTLDFDDFADTLEENEMQALVTKEIGDPKIESTLLQRICGANHLLHAPDIAKLMQKPIYSATFKFNNPGKDRLMLNLELSYEEGTTTVQQKRWYKIKHSEEDLRRVLDVNMVNLSQGFAWNLVMTAAGTVEESSLSEDYQNFPDSLSLNTKSPNFPVYDPHDGKSLKVPLQSVYQKRLWRFETKFGYWYVEAAGGQETAFSGREISSDRHKWTLNVLNSKHEPAFSSNAGAGVGELAAWGPGRAIEELFPFDWEPSFSSEESPQKKMTTSFQEHIEGKGKKVKEEKPQQKKMINVGAKGKRNIDLHHDPDHEPDLRGLQQLLRLLHGLHDVVVEGSTSP